MKNLQKRLIIFALFLAFTAVQVKSQTDDDLPPQINSKTFWKLSPSFKFDTLCFLNTLSGDEYYLEYYDSDFQKFKSKLTPKVRLALANLKRKIKDENKGIISAFLTLYFSAVDDENLDQMLKTIENSTLLKSNLKNSPYFNENDWKLFESVKQDLSVIFRFLKRINFERTWRKEILPKVNSRISLIEKSLPNYDVISQVESHLGRGLSSNTITVYMLYYSQPHGIKITGTRFLTDVAWSFGIVLRNSVHEMMHPPYDLAKDEKLRAALNLLRQDEFLMDKVANHNPAFGYNSFEGFVEEDIVQATEQIINEKLGIAVDARQRWKNADGGMHVLAAALYSVMKKEEFPKGQESLSCLLIKVISSGKLTSGKIQALHDDFHENVDK